MIRSCAIAAAATTEQEFLQLAAQTVGETFSAARTEVLPYGGAERDSLRRASPVLDSSRSGSAAWGC